MIDSEKMIDRESVIRQLTQHIARAENIENDWMDCVSIPMLRGALELLKADQTYLQKLTERLQRIADIAGDYDNYPTRNGLEWVCIEIQEIAMHGLQEVKDENT